MFLAEGSRVIPVSPEIAFDKLADFSSWKDWMPRSFRPSRGRARTTTLREGDRVRVRIAGAPVASSIEIATVDRPREISWRGGPRGVLHAHHRFLFEPHAEGTLVRSVESWEGPLAAIFRFLIRPGAERIGGQQLAALAHAVSP